MRNFHTQFMQLVAFPRTTKDDAGVHLDHILYALDASGIVWEYLDEHNDVREEGWYPLTSRRVIDQVAHDDSFNEFGVAVGESSS